MARKSEKPRISIGVSLTQRKIESLFTPSFINHAKHQGIDLILVDLHQPLSQHPPLDYLIHKPYHQDWKIHLLDFQSRHPNVLIIDSIPAIERVNNRDSMLSFIPSITLQPSKSSTLTTTIQYGPTEVGSKSNTPTFGVPSQILLLEATKESNLTLQFPVIAKPLDAESHLLSLVFNSTGLQKVKQQAPLVLQEFVNHGGVMFKVYVAGRHVKCVHRKSLPDFHLSNYSVEQLEEGVFPFTRVSNLPPTTTNVSSSEETVSMPPLDFVQNLATAVRKKTQLHLFNLDLIRDANNVNKYFIIDINYFTGYEKFQGFEAMLTDFFLDIVQKNDTI